MTAVAAYVVEISQDGADRTNVTGAATLAGTVQAALVPGGGLARRSYTILSAAGGLGGTTFSGVAGLPTGFSGVLSYTSTEVLLSLIAALGAGGGLNRNQQNVANALNIFFNNGGTLPPNFLSIFGLAGYDLANALTLLSGEAATGAQQSSFQLMNHFLGLMLDPYVQGRAGVGGATGAATAFAPERTSAAVPDIVNAFAAVPKGSARTPSVEPHWSVWGGGYGGYSRSGGNPLVEGSHELTSRTAGFAAGMDHRIAPGTIFGFALAGGGTGWSSCRDRAAEGAKRFRPVSMVLRVRDRLISQPRSPSRIIGCQPIASRSPAIISAQNSPRKAMALVSKAVCV